MLRQSSSLYLTNASLKSYLIGLWFSLRTHATQIWQNPQQLLHPMDLNAPAASSRLSIYHKLIPGGQQKGTLHHKPSVLTTQTTESAVPSRSQTPVPRVVEPVSNDPQHSPVTPTVPNPLNRRISYANPPVVNAPGYTPILESVDHAIKVTGIQPLQLPWTLTTD